MIRLFRSSPSRLALVYIVLSVLVLGVFASPHYSTLRTYVDGDEPQRMVELFEREGAPGLAAGAGRGPVSIEHLLA